MAGIGVLEYEAIDVGIPVLINKNKKKDIHKSDRKKTWLEPNQWLLRLQTEDRYATMGNIAKLFSESYFLVGRKKENNEIIVLVEAESEKLLDQNTAYLEAKCKIKNIKKMMKLGDDMYHEVARINRKI